MLTSFGASDTVTRSKSSSCNDIHGLIGSCYIGVTGLPLAERAQLQAEIDRLVASHTLHGSESLCKLLRYLGKQAAEHPGIPIKEYQIATEVFGRQADFDPQLDSMVRVQAGRLRAKLAEYYNAEGAHDSLIIEIPKGSYAIAVHERIPAVSPLNGELLGAASLGQGAGTQGARTNRIVSTLSIALIAAIAIIGWLVWTRREAVSSATVSAAAAVPAPIEIFWKGFVRGPDEPWVIFSNAQFVGRPDTGMRYYDAARDGKTPILDHYTGVGEVLAVHNLDRVFGSLHQSLRVKRGSLFSLDDAKNNDLIFIGSPSENLTLLDIPSTREFVFQKVREGPRSGNMEIINVKPEQGESSRYLASPSNVPMSEDYAVVALVKAINPEHYQLILAGTTTIGTQAAVEYVTRENYLHDLLAKMNVTSPGELKPFEAVIQVKVAKGVPVESSMAALRILK